MSGMKGMEMFCNDIFPALCSYLMYSDPDMKSLINPWYEAQIMTDKTFVYQSLQKSINVTGNDRKL